MQAIARAAGWRADPRAGADGFMLVAVALLRLSYLVTGAIAIAYAGSLSTGHLFDDIGLLVSSAAWSLVLAALVSRRGPVIAATFADVAVAVALLVAVSGIVTAGQRITWGNWSLPYALSTAVLAVVTLRLRHAALAVALLVGGMALGVGTRLTGVPDPVDFVGNLLSVVWFAVVAALCHAFLRRNASLVEEANLRLREVEADRAAEQARAAERLRHRQALHDTVLSTLTALARGGLDHRSEAVRARCAAHAEYVRRLIEGEGEQAGDSLGAEFGEVADEAASLGLRVNLQVDVSGDQPPRRVVEALLGATREALNNVQRHADTDTATVTVVVEGGKAQVLVVDRGVGMPAGAGWGFGLTNSVSGRLHQAGGVATVTSYPGEGTAVELRWPA